MNKAYSFSLILLVATIGMITLISLSGEPVVVKTNLENIPMRIGDYIGTEDSFPDSVYEELNADFHLYRHYQNQYSNIISLYIGYYGTAKGGRTGHNPYACLPGAGWAIIQTEKVIIPRGDGEIELDAIVAKKGNQFETVMHWYQSNENKILTSGIQQNIQRFVGRIARNRNDGAFVRLSMVTSSERLTEAIQAMKSFAGKVLTILPNYWPEEE